MYEYFNFDYNTASFEWDEEFVVCAFRENNTVRLISAGIAAKPEKERYEHGDNEIG